MHAKPFNYDRLETMMREHGLTLCGLLRELKIAGSAGTKWKNGGYPNAENMKKLTDFFHVPPNYFLLDEDEEASPELRIIQAYYRMNKSDRAIVDLLVDKYAKK